MRAVWPKAKHITDRFSAHDWAEGGNTQADALAIAEAFKKAGVDLLIISSGGVVAHEKPVYGRMYQVPFSDIIRNGTGMPTMAVGNITDGDQVNSILAAGRADLVAIARPMLANPNWFWHELQNLQAEVKNANIQTHASYAAGFAQRKQLLLRQESQADFGKV